MPKEQAFRMEAAAGGDQESPVHISTDAIATVEAEKLGWVQIRLSGVTGWVSKDDVIPMDEALSYFSERIRQNSKDDRAYSARACVHEQKGQFDLALKDVDEAIHLQAAAGIYYFNRARTYYGKGDYSKAVADFMEGIKLDPSHAKSHCGLAWLLATCPDPKQRDGKRAVDYAKRACDLSDWKDPYSLDTLAAAYAEVGDFNAALKWQRAALDDESFTKQFGERAQRRLKLYQEGKPFHER